MTTTPLSGLRLTIGTFVVLMADVVWSTFVRIRAPGRIEVFLLIVMLVGLGLEVCERVFKERR